MMGCGGALAVGLGEPTLAQVIPDSSLGAERSTVTPNVVIRGLPSDRIDGGAIRGLNLFHSFEQFNVGTERGVYFTNPAGIENILSRVTGSNRSEILGRLGILGNGNLFLLNPNGIVFGPSASLDVTGSFTATTANAIALGDQGFFSATQPERSKLLAIAPGALFFDQLARQPGTIQNSGNLAVGRDLTLAADNLELQGQVRSGGNLTLQAQDTLHIRDSVTAPFIAAAGGNLLVQGDQSVDIFALNHPDSGLFSGGNMVLRSANTVGGDAHYWSSGDFRIEQPDKSLGSFFSPYDPIIVANGNVSFNSYTGQSLHILAGGSVVVSGNISITDADRTGNAVTETVTLSDGTLLAINGSAQPTIDIRAGIDWAQLRGLPGNFGIGVAVPPSVFDANVTNADITIANIEIENSNGLVFLTNQYAPNSSLVGGNITITAPDFFDEGIDVRVLQRGADNGGSVIFDSRNNIAVSGGIATVSTSGSGGNVKLLAREDIFIGRRGLGIDSGIITSTNARDAGDVTIRAGGSVTISGTRIISNLLPLAVGQGGDIDIRARSFSMSNGARIDAKTSGNGDAGRITIDVDDAVTLDSRGSIFNNVEKGAIGNSGGIKIRTRSLALSLGSLIDATTFGNGDAGKITIDVDNAATLATVSTISSNVEEGAAGNSGGIEIYARSLALSGNALIDASTFGNGDAGKITIDVDDAATLDSRSFIFNNIEEGSIGNSSGVEIHARSLALNGGAQIFVGNVGGNGTLGNIFIDTTDSVSLTGIIADPRVRTASTGIGNRLEPGSVGTGGDIIINTGLLSLSGGQISASTRGEGNAGSVRINARDSISLAAGAGIFSSVDSGGVGNGGEIRIDATSLSISQSPIQTIVRGTSEGLPAGCGNSGNITVTLRGDLEILDNDSPNFSGILTSISEGVTETATAGDIPTAGDIHISAKNLLMSGNRAQVRSTLDFFSSGEAGNIDVQVQSLTMSNRAEITTGSSGLGNAGNISIGVTDSASLTTNATISSGVSDGGNGNGGNINFEAGSLSLTSGSQFLTSIGRLVGNANGQLLDSLPPAQGNAGDVNIAVRGAATFDGVGNASLTNSRVPSGIVSAVSSELGKTGGNIAIQSSSLIVSNGAKFSSATNGTGRAGNIEIDVGQFTLLNQAEVSSSTFSKGSAGSVQIQANSIALTSGALLTSQSRGDGNAGNIFLTAWGLLQANDATISTATDRSAGGAIEITAKDIRLKDNSDITTFVGSGAGGGGNITLTAQSIIALNDSDILSFASDGKGGNITFNTPAFFGQNYRPGSPPPFDGNNRVDINASGTVSGIITLPDVSFLQNSLTEFSQTFTDTTQLLANSCIVRGGQQNGSFTITGSGGLPQRPGDAPVSPFPTGEVRTVPETSVQAPDGNTLTQDLAPTTQNSPDRPWEIGDPIVEPQGVYKLANGELVVSRECP
ncbi:MAG: filamentous hemagglutinin N-terminal domain-containing protein [Lyngbya sp. HA4199-MV5]|jgi:filamentous hemagglutinin family protein|nr:filamentous hemagglutinin N-terminal domain-containing protein [Lyngbya sp. HA4199-MV5]